MTIVLVILGLAAGYVVLCLVAPTKRCGACSGARVRTGRRGAAVCSRCRGTGRTRRIGASSIHQFVQALLGRR